MQRPGRAGRLSPTTFAVLAAGLFLAGCAGMQEHDRTGELTREDYKDMLPDSSGEAAAQEKAEKAEEAPEIPGMTQDLVRPEAPRGVRDRRVSVNLNEKTPVKDVLLELASKVNVDLEMAPEVGGRVILTAQDRRFEEVVERLTRMADLRHEFKDGVLRIWPDKPYMKTYKVDYLNMSRKSSGSMSTSTSVFSQSVGDGGGGGGGEGNGSSTTIESETNNAFWEELRKGLTHILGSVRSGAPAQQAMAGLQQAGGGDSGDGGEGGKGGSAGGGSGGAAKAGRFSIHKQAGVVSVYASAKGHEAVADWLTQVRQSVAPQVLIEAKVVEVELEDEYRGGINWNTLQKTLTNTTSVDMSGTGFVPKPSTEANTIWAGDNGAFQLTVDNQGADRPNIDAIMNFVKGFGTTRTLSSPRLTVANNQTSVIKVAQNYVFFDIEAETENIEGGGTRNTCDTEVRTVPIGFLMTVQPSIDISENDVQLYVRPTLANLTDTKDDPAISSDACSEQGGGGTGDFGGVPVVSVQEMESVLKLDSGKVAVLGGLMQQKSEAEDVGLPGAKDVPIAGQLFKRKQDATKVVELVIFLKATVLNNGTDSVAPADEKLYNKFTQDPRPLDF